MIMIIYELPPPPYRIVDWFWLWHAPKLTSTTEFLWIFVTWTVQRTLGVESPPYWIIVFLVGHFWSWLLRWVWNRRWSGFGRFAFWQTQKCPILSSPRASDWGFFCVSDCGSRYFPIELLAWWSLCSSRDSRSLGPLFGSWLAIVGGRKAWTVWSIRADSLAYHCIFITEVWRRKNTLMAKNMAVMI